MDWLERRHDESGGGDPMYDQPAPSRNTDGVVPLLLVKGGASAGSFGAASVALKLCWLSVAHRHAPGATAASGTRSSHHANNNAIRSSMRRNRQSTPSVYVSIEPTLGHASPRRDATCCCCRAGAPLHWYN